MNNKLTLTTQMSPKGDQVKAIDQLVDNINNGIKKQVLLGATGTGKTFTIANVLSRINKKALVIVHNKTLAAQLYSEFKELFQKNKVEYYISYFDFYQPEAYLPGKDLYIEKSSKANQEIEMLRLSTIKSLATEERVIVIASVAAIYPSVKPDLFEKFRVVLSTGIKYDLTQLQYDLVRLQYERNNIDLPPGSFRLKGDVLYIAEGATNQYHIRVSFFGNEIEEIVKVDTLQNKVIEKWKTYVIYPANEYIADNDQLEESLKRIREELNKRIKYFKNDNRLLEAQRISDRTNHDLESLSEIGFTSGIENYARHLELRDKDSTPYTIFDYLGDDWILIVDESHMTIPQVKGMYFGDRSRKETLVEYGFRLPSALDNRPLNFQEFENKVKSAIYVSATPAQYEIEKSNKTIVEQIVRPTGLLDPVITVKPSENQIDTLIELLQEQKKKNERTIITVLTIKMAEELAYYLQQKKFKVAYLHNELKTLERTKIINDLRKGIFDTVVGINLLREGLDIPEVSLVCIFDADKPGFFRSYEALIQTFGRAARNENARVVMFADAVNDQMLKAINETNRRRKIQMEYNTLHGITPKTIVKPIYDDFESKQDMKSLEILFSRKVNLDEKAKSRAISILRKQMNKAAKDQEYEQAAAFRDMIIELEGKLK